MARIRQRVRDGAGEDFRSRRRRGNRRRQRGSVRGRARVPPRAAPETMRRARHALAVVAEERRGGGVRA